MEFQQWMPRKIKTSNQYCGFISIIFSVMADRHSRPFHHESSLHGTATSLRARHTAYPSLAICNSNYSVFEALSVICRDSLVTCRHVTCHIIAMRSSYIHYDSPHVDYIIHSVRLTHSPLNASHVDCIITVMCFLYT